MSFYLSILSHFSLLFYGHAHKMTNNSRNADWQRNVTLTEVHSEEPRRTKVPLQERVIGGLIDQEIKQTREALS